MIQQGKKIYLCDLNLKPITVLNGIKTDTVNCNLRVKDYSELTFDVDEYILVNGKKEKSLGYDQLVPYMTLYLEDTAMFQLQQPTQQNDGNGETKSIVAYSLEKEFEDTNWVNFKCNTGEKDSLEQLVDGNLNDLGFAINFVTFYNKENHALSFIHLLLDKMPGWSADDADIDEILWDRKIPSITQDNINLYSLCCSTIAPRMNLLFLFDTIHRKIKAIAKENLDNKKYESPVFISYRNLAKSIDVQTDEDSIFTRFNVRGDNDLNVLNCNYGDYYIYNLDYFLCSPYMSNELQEKVKTWTKYRDDNREFYIQVAKSRSDANQKLNEIIYRNPSDDLNIKQWDGMNEEGLNESLKYYNTLLTSLQISVDPDWDASNKDFSTYTPWKKSDGSVDHDRYLEKLKNLDNGYGGYYTYYDILHYIIPNIEIAISNLNKPDDQKTEYIKDWETNWDLYGTSELDTLKKKYTAQLETLSDYAKDWKDMTDEEKSKHSNNESNYAIYHEKYVIVNSYVRENGTLLSAIEKRNAEKESAEKILNQYQSQMNEFKSNASIDNKTWNFTDKEKITLYSLFHDEDYENTNILSTSLDDSITEIDREKELFDDATDKLSEVSQPQYKFTTSLDNLYNLKEFECWHDELKLLKFIRLGIRDDYSVKLRLISIRWNPCEVTDDLTLEFSNMITSRSGRSDLNELLDSDNNRGAKNSISFGTDNSDSEKAYLTAMLQQMVKMGIFKNAVSGIVSGTEANFDEIKVNNLIAKYIQTSTLKADTIKANQITGWEDSKTLIDFVNNQINTVIVNTDIGNIKNLLAGNAGVGDLQAIKLTVDNAIIDEAVVKKLIASKISVADLATHSATAEIITLVSQDGKPSIGFKGSTQQFYDNNGNVRVQIGQDATGDFTFSLFDETGSGILIDSKEGVHSGAIKDGLIVNDMLKDDSISKNKLNFPIVETDENGKVSITEILDGNGNEFGISYQEFQDSVNNGFASINNSISSLSGSVATVELIGEQVFIDNGSSISPESITIKAETRNGAEISKWYIDDVENSSYVSSDKHSLTLPSSYMQNKKTVTIKVECTDTNKYDVMSIYRVVDGSASYTVTIKSSKGSLFKIKNNDEIETIDTVCECTVYRGADIVDNVKSYTWKYLDGNLESNWIDLGTGKQITVSLKSSIAKKRIKCVVEI